MEQKEHSHIIAKIFLAVGLIDLVATVVFLVLGAPFSPFSLLRFFLWVVLPFFFIVGAFDKQEPSG